jgi:hypothetical protein
MRSVRSCLTARLSHTASMQSSFCRARKRFASIFSSLSAVFLRRPLVEVLGDVRHRPDFACNSRRIGFGHGWTCNMGREAFSRFMQCCCNSGGHALWDVCHLLRRDAEQFSKPDTSGQITPLLAGMRTVFCVPEVNLWIRRERGSKGLA